MIKSRVLIKSFQYKLIQDAIQYLTFELKKNNILFSNFTYLPTKIEKFTILISPHVDKNARDQFEIRTYRAFFYVYEDEENLEESYFIKEIIYGVEVEIEGVY